MVSEYHSKKWQANPTLKRDVMTFLNLLRSQRLIAVLRGEDPTHIRRAAEALIDEGIGIIELTFTVPHALEIVRDLNDAPAEVGLGTITDPVGVEQAVGAGAHFLVSPGSSASLLEALSECGIPSLPGVQSPSEVMMADDAGFDVVKLFPASLVGPGYIADLKGPFPDLEVVPSGGIGLSDAASWLSAGAAAVGLGALARPNDIAFEDWGGIRKRAQSALKAVGRAND